LETLTFSEEPQLAFLGHVLTDKNFFNKCSGYVDPEWFLNPVVSEIYKSMLVFKDSFNRAPEPLEIKQSKFFDKKETEFKNQIPLFIDKALILKDSYGIDVIKSEIDKWFSMVKAKATMNKAIQEFNAHEIEKAWATLNAGYIEKTSSSFESGSGPVFSDSPAHAVEERYERIEQSKSILSYGVGYLDDALGGIIPNDLILLGAKLGSGKTSLATAIATTNARNGKLAYYFALEAENHEIERRAKFSILSNIFYRSVPKEKWPPFGAINYLDWRMGRLEALLGPFEAEALDIVSKEMKSLKTLYRTSGDFNIDTLDKHLSAISQEAELIVIDHLHYVDTNGDNENSAYKNITKKIRDACLKYSVPVIVVAHLRKDPGGARGKVLINNYEDFHGTSDVPKIATTCIMVAPAFNENKRDAHLWPTYVRSVKTRLENVRTRYTAVLDFNVRNNTYEDKYRLGMLADVDTTWNELDPSDRPFWAKNAVTG
jgi:replicative DNA helicase